MALRVRNEDGTSYSFTDIGRDFLRVGCGYSLQGAGHYTVRIMLSGTMSSICMGLCGAAIGGTLTGSAALPFLICACGGFVFGAWGYYRTSLRESMIVLERYPRLLQLHLDANFPQKNFLSWRQDQSMLMVAWLTAQPAVNKVFEEREQQLVDEARSEILLEAKEQALISES
ncbi:hypothetical protein B0A48_18721 [Cryoendolithus antarcticus]|uniref:Uncharacterized protein n=1 Tax=Cryoendolithus antarcticus TaxID=1507870 RepID=A0A1V8S7X9_9PEZI|nr:hypothetical protein B0A48_18721 [Cryoendolithus antarcticus]